MNNFNVMCILPGLLFGYSPILGVTHCECEMAVSRSYEYNQGIFKKEGATNIIPLNNRNTYSRRMMNSRF